MPVFFLLSLVQRTSDHLSFSKHRLYSFSKRSFIKGGFKYDWERTLNSCICRLSWTLRPLQTEQCRRLRLHMKRFRKSTVSMWHTWISLRRSGSVGSSSGRTIICQRVKTVGLLSPRRKRKRRSSKRLKLFRWFKANKAIWRGSRSHTAWSAPFLYDSIWTRFRNLSGVIPYISLKLRINWRVSL